MKSFTVKVGEEEFELRLKSSDAVKIEANNKVKLLDFIQDYSITTIVTLLRYMLQGGQNREVKEKEALDFYDKLVDNDWAIETMITDLIMPACEASGLLTKSDLELIKAKQVEVKTQATQA